MTPETKIKQVVKPYLQFKGWFVFYNLQGVGAYKGIPDFICLRNGRTVYMEIKTPKGVLSPNQETFQADIGAHHGEYVVIRSLEDVLEWEKEAA